MDTVANPTNISEAFQLIGYIITAIIAVVSYFLGKWKKGSEIKKRYELKEKKISSI